MAHSQISCEIYLFTQGKNQYKNLQTFSDLARYSSGNLYHYADFNARSHSTKFQHELWTNLTRKLAWEAVFRVRLSHGYRQIGTFGNFTIKAKTADLVLCPVIDQDRVLAYEIEKSDITNENAERTGRRDHTHLYIQSALLYSNSEGQRRIRVHNMAIPTTSMKQMPLEHMDLNATTAFFGRMALSRLNQNVNFTVIRGLIEM